MERGWNKQIKYYKMSFEELDWILDWIENGEGPFRIILLSGMKIGFDIDMAAEQEVLMKLTYSDDIDVYIKEELTYFFSMIDKILEY